MLARGLCLICVREEKPQSKCEHNDVTLSCLSYDPIGTLDKDTLSVPEKRRHGPARGEISYERQ